MFDNFDRGYSTQMFNIIKSDLSLIHIFVFKIKRKLTAGIFIQKQNPIKVVPVMIANKKVILIILKCDFSFTQESRSFNKYFLLPKI